MVSSERRLLYFASPLVAIGCLIVALLDPDRQGWIEILTLGLFFGTMFGQTTIAAAWTVLGPGPLLVRVPTALAWVVLFGAATMVNIGIHGGPPLHVAGFLTGCLLGQWTLLQVALWPAALCWRLRLRPRDVARLGLDPRDWQFGIGQLMILTAIVAVVLGIGRFVVVRFGSQLAQGPDNLILVFLAVAAVVLSVPPLVAALLPRWWTWGTLATVGGVALATVWEATLARQLALGTRPNVWDLAIINGVTVGWVLAFAAVARGCGCVLGTPREGKG